VVPVDDTHSWTFGLRHFNDLVDLEHKGLEEECGYDPVAFVGQDGNRPYAERQCNPGDLDAQVSQRPIPIHELEHRGSTDVGVAMPRRIVRETIRGEKMPFVSTGKANGQEVIYTYSHDTVLRVLECGDPDDEVVQRQVASCVMEVIKSGDTLDDSKAREAHIVACLKQIEAIPFLPE
jgi:hypothetical protein